MVQNVTCPKCDWGYASTPNVPPGTSNEDAIVRVKNAKSWAQSMLFRHMKEKHRDADS